MGNTVQVAQPYIVDEFESEDEDLPYESAVETVDKHHKRNSCEDESSDSSEEEVAVKRRGRHLKVSPEATLNLDDEAKTLAYLLGVLEGCESDASKKAAAALKGIELNENLNKSLQHSETYMRPNSNYSHFLGSMPSEQSMSETDSPPLEVKSSQVTLSPVFSTDCESNTFTENSEAATDSCTDTEDYLRNKVLAQLDEDLNQFEAAEAAVAVSPHCVTSHIPKPTFPIVSRKERLSGGDGTETILKRSPPDGKRGQSPGKPRASGIPRFSPSPNHSSTYAAINSSALETETERMTLDICPTETSYESVSCAGNLLQGESSLKEDNQEEEDHSAWNVNISEVTGRVHQTKKRSGIPSLWSKGSSSSPVRNKSAGDQHVEPAPHKPSSISAPLSEGEMARVRTIGELGNTSERKVFDLKRWYCISRPQYKTSCGISSVVSCWNFLYSTIGHGNLKPLTQEAAMKILGFQSPFDDIKFGPFTGNLTLLRWFQELNAHFQVKGKGYFLYKPCGKNRTAGVTEEQALQQLKHGLQDSNRGFIYHCHNHYFCPIGYEDTPIFCVDAYKPADARRFGRQCPEHKVTVPRTVVTVPRTVKFLDTRKVSGRVQVPGVRARAEVGDKAVDTWILIGDTSRKYPCIQCKSWEEICIDLNCAGTSFFNIRQNWRGVISKENSRRPGLNLHCIMAFQKEDPGATSHTSLSSSWSRTSSRLPILRQNSSQATNQNSPTFSACAMGQGNLTDTETPSAAMPPAVGPPPDSSAMTVSSQEDEEVYMANPSFTLSCSHQLLSHYLARKHSA